MRLYNLISNYRIINISILNNHLIDYPTPININYFWGFGSLAGICLGIQLISGILLSMHYTPHISMAFDSVEHIMRDVNNGWLFRYLHSNGASIFFIIVYIHIARGLYFKSYRNKLLWLSGVIIFFLMILTAFMGYVLVWGQMSFWGATVITNLASAIPFIGNNIARWLWGGFSIDNATLNRFFSFHFVVPFIIAGLAISHLALLHNNGSTNPLATSSKLDKVAFYPYFYLKDLFGLFFILGSLFLYFLFFDPNILGHPDNYIKANALVTPAHIVPEWYFLVFYAILRSIPNKEGGVVFMVLSILILALLPNKTQILIRSPKFDYIFQIFYWFFIAISLLLGWLGAQAVEQPFVIAGQIGTFLYFSYFLNLLPEYTNCQYTLQKSKKFTK